MLTQNEVDYLLFDAPVLIGKECGFTKLQDIHNDWIKDMILGAKDSTLQAHRGSYKTTCVSIALAIIAVAQPNIKTIFVRKTDSDVKEVISQVKKILLSDAMQAIAISIYGVPIQLVTDNAGEINTNLSYKDARGTSQIVAMGSGGSITGKHFDKIFTDDIVNLSDRISKAEREKTKLFYQELQNIKNRDGRIFNTGTPWHIDDCFSIMPEAKKFDCYHTGMISAAELSELKSKMLPSLFAANYELRHIASEDVIFTSPNVNAEMNLCEQGIAHVDASYGGDDYTAFTIYAKHDGKHYVFGKLWHKHIDDCLNEIYQYMDSFLSARMYCEDNADKGYLAKKMREKIPKVHKYHESMNKFVKITAYIKPIWKDIYFVAGTDEEYINQICDFNENAEHDDAPDSLASAIREQSKKKETASQNADYMLL